MANPGFYNDNQFRDYPFRSRVSPLAEEGWSSSASYAATELPQACIVDFGAIIRPGAEFVDGQDYVYLRSASRSGSTLELSFALSSLGVAYSIEFSINTTLQEFVTYWADSNAVTRPVGELYACEDEPAWTAYLATGNPAALLEELEDGELWLFQQGLWQILPARIQNLIGTQVQSLTIANIRRTVAAVSRECDSSLAAETQPATAHIVEGCIIGDVKFSEGFNCSLRYDLRENSIVINASPGAGRGLPCEEIEAFPGETKPSGSDYYSGGPSCADIVRFVNGASAADLLIRAGAGFNVTTDTEQPHTLIIERSLNAFTVCEDPLPADSEILSSVSESAFWLE